MSNNYKINTDQNELIQVQNRLNSQANLPSHRYSLIKHALESNYMSSLQHMETFVIDIDPRRSTHSITSSVQSRSSSPNVHRQAVSNSISKKPYLNSVDAHRLLNAELHSNRLKIEDLYNRLDKLENKTENSFNGSKILLRFMNLVCCCLPKTH